MNNEIEDKRKKKSKRLWDCYVKANKSILMCKKCCNKWLEEAKDE